MSINPDLDEQMRRFEERTARPKRTRVEIFTDARDAVKKQLDAATARAGGSFRMESQRVAAKEEVERLENLVADLGQIIEDEQREHTA